MTSPAADRLLIASLTGPDGVSLRAQAADSAEHADLLEIRLDLLREAHPGALDNLRTLGKPLLLTLRSAHEGGHDTRDPEGARGRLMEFARPGDWLDWEAVRGAPPPWPTDKLIISRHIPGAATADDLRNELAALCGVPARFYKLIFTARTLQDTLNARAVLTRAQADGIPLACFAMGELGVPSRLLALSWGSAAVFGCAPGESDGAASGQLPVDIMARLYRVREISAATRLLGVTGNPVLHSLSPALHNPRFSGAGLDARFLPLPAVDFNDFLGFAHAVNLAAAAVTTPFKNPAFAHAGRTSPEADAAGAVNTMLFSEGRPAWGGNTDGEGVLAPLAPWLHFPKMSRVLIAGYGPAARAAGAAIGRLCPAVFFTGRKKPDHALTGPWLDSEAAAQERFSILINATPVAAPLWEAPLSGLMKQCPPVILEMDYRDPVSPHLYPPGVQVIDGRDMLRAQGEAQARIFIAHLVGAAVA